MEITRAHAWYRSSFGDRQQKHVPAETVAQIKQRRCMDLPALAVYNKAMLLKKTVTALEADVKALDGTPADKHDDPNVVVLDQEHTNTSKALIGRATFGATTEMSMYDNGTCYYIAAAQHRGKDVGQLYKGIDGEGFVNELVERTDGSILFTTGTLTSRERNASLKFLTG